MKLFGRSKCTGALVGFALAVATLIQFGVSGPVLAADAGLSTPPAQTTTPAPAPTSTPTSTPTTVPTPAPIATDIPGATATASQSGSKIAPQIVGGEEATIADAPWQVALIRATASDEYQGQFCGGSLIAAQWVLTAAHCVVNDNNVVSTPASINILAGQDTLSQETNVRAVTVAEIKVHPLYSADAEHDDIALIKLTSALTLEPGQIETIALPWTPPSAGNQELITGWGTVEFDTNNYPTVLRKATVSVFDDQVCADSYASFDPEKMFCAGSEFLDRDTCQGDSGGPSAEFWNSASTWVLAGVTSFGAGCANGTDPGVYTNVFSYRSWINQHLLTSPTISGKVTAKTPPSTTATALPFAEVYLLSEAGAGSLENDVNAQYVGFEAWAVTDASGNYSLLPPAPGNYVLAFRPPESRSANLAVEYWNDKPAFVLADRITFGTTSLTGKDAALNPPGTITGRVFAQGSPTVGVEGVNACARVTATETMTCVETNSLGNYSIPNLANGSFKLYFFAGEQAARPLASAWLAASGTSWVPVATYALATAQTVTAAGGTLASRNVTLAVRPSISGNVTDDSGEPISDAVVELYDSDDWFVEQTVTDADGRYTLYPQDGGTYRLKFSDDGNLGLSPEWFDDKPDSVTATRVTLGTTNLTGKNVVLSPPASISGSVSYTVDGTLMPFAGATVCASTHADDMDVICDTSTETGDYFIQGLSSGSYKVFADISQSETMDAFSTWWGGTSSYETAGSLTISTGTSLEGRDISLRVPSTISGTVTANLTGAPEPVPEVMVLAYDSNYTFVRETYTDNLGEYTIPGLAAGTYKLEFWSQNYLNVVDEWYNNAADFGSATEIVVTDSQQATGKDVELQRGATISGTVTSGGLPLSNVDVHAYADCCDDEPFVSARTDGDGNYVLQRLPAGKYYLKFEAQDPPTLVTEYLGHKAIRAKSTPVVLAQGQAKDGTNFDMRVGATISGSVTLAADGSPAQGTQVYALSIGGRYAGRGGEVDADGNYSITGIGAGIYYVKADPNGASLNAVSQWADGSSNPLDADSITLDYGQSQTTNFSLNAGSTISGIVTQDDGTGTGNVHPVSGQEVSVWQWGSPAVDLRNPNSYQWTVFTDENGAYRVGGLEPGVYKVCLEDGPVDSVISRGCFGGTLSVATADPVPLAADADAANIDITMGLVGGISGVVLNADADYAPKPYAPVFLFQAGQIPELNYGLALATTAADGTYSFDNVPVGDYIVRVGYEMWFNESFLTEYFNDSYSFNSATPIEVVVGSASALPPIEVSSSRAAEQPQASATGKVVTAANVGIANVDVFFVCPTSWGYDTTDSLGAYTVDYLKPGTCNVSYSARPDVGSTPLNYLAATRSASVAAGTNTLTNQTLATGGSISGTVKNAAGQGVHANLAVVDLSGQCVGILESAANGTYFLPRLTTGSYRVGVTDSCSIETGERSTNSYQRVTQGNTVPDRWFGGKAFFDVADSISVTAGSATTGKDIVVATETRAVSGTVTRAQTTGDPIPESDYTVVLSPWAQQKISSRDPSALTAGDGTFDIRNLAPGDYYATLLSNDMPDTVWRGADGAGDAEKIRVQAGEDTTGVAVTLPVLHEVQAIISAPNSVAQFCHTYESEPAFTDAQGNRYVVSWPRAWADASAAYITGLLPVGTYTFSLTCSGTTLWYGGASQSTATTISVTDSHDSPVVKWSLEASAAAEGSISGMVTYPVGGRPTPIGQISVALFDSTSTLIAQTSTNVNGGYAFAGLANGSYKVFFNRSYPFSTTDGRPDFASEWWNNGVVKANATNVVISAGAAVSNINASLATAAGTVQPGRVAVTGTYKVGQTLTASAGTWTTGTTLLYQWTRMTVSPGRGSLYAEGTPIPGATLSTYVLTAADVGSYVGLTIVGEKSGWTSSSKWAYPGLVQGTSMTAGTVTITGTAAVGNTLTANRGTWTPASSTYGYQWRRGTIDIPGATDSTYQVRAADLGNTLSVVITGSASTYQMAAATSAATAAVVAGTLTTATPTIAGTPSVGTELTGVTGAWGPSPVALTYQWIRTTTTTPVVTTVVGTELAYTVVTDDVGKALTFKVFGTKDGYTSTNKTSTAVTGLGVWTQTSTPVITGIPTFGNTLQATQVTTPNLWLPAPTSFTYQWKRNGANITTGGSAAFYVLVADDVGKTITVAVSGAKTNYAASPQTSEPTAAVAALTYTTTPTPTITGNKNVGQILTAVTGTWSPTPTSYLYQWYRGTDPIGSPSATSTYTLVAADLDAQMKVSVTAVRAGYVLPSRESAQTTAIARALFTTSQTPTISGAAKVGSTLTAVSTAWVPAVDRYTYQWNRAGVPIDSDLARASTYVVVPDDLGRAITVTVTGTKAGYTDAPKLSAATATIALGTFVTPPVPTITGTKVVGDTVTANEGTWSSTPDAFTYVWKRGTTTISGATDKTYQLQAADRGQPITVLVTGVRAGFTSATSAPSAAFTGIVAPFTTAPIPTITVSGDGVAAVGKVLTAVAGVWSPAAATPPTTASPTALSYVWKRNGVAISGATASTYTLVAADLSQPITVTVRGTLTGYVTTDKTSAATDAIIKGTFATAPTPTITLSTGATAPFATKTITATVGGTWLPTQDSFTYQWAVGGDAVALPSATLTSYVVKTTDLGKTITMTVTAKKNGYDDLARIAESAPVTLGFITWPTTPAPTKPTITGTVKAGNMLTATKGTAPVGAAFVGYQWSRATTAAGVYTNIAEAVSDTYTLTGADTAKFIKVAAIWSKTDYSNTSALSVATSIAVAAGTLSSALTHYIDGSANVGSTLTANEGAWSPTPDSYTYKWLISTSSTGTYTAIASATARTYRVAAGDLNKFLKVDITAVKTGYTTSVAFRSAATAAVQSALPD